ncbi:DUF5694 domain-containing protein [Oxalobacteraceae bacterium A2-2]
MTRLFITALLAATVHGPVLAGPDFSPGAYKLQRGTSNEAMVLGTPHLSGLPKSFDTANLGLLLDRLAEWRPQAIAIEALSGMQCAYLRSYPQRYRDSIAPYCWDPAPATSATGLEVPAANARAAELLAAWPASPSPAQRRTLASVFLAAGEPSSALVQWLRLPESERHAGDGLNDSLVAVLEKLRQRRNEDNLVAAPLAASLGLERVYPMDDHTSDAASADEKAAGEAIMKAWDNPYTAARRKQDDELRSSLTSPASVVAMYRAYNARGTAEQAFHSDFGAALEEPSPQRYGRSYVAYWEVRNLRMAANIREVMLDRPGIRTLVIVGASHKGYLEAYLDQMHDVRIVSTEQVLR